VRHFHASCLYFYPNCACILNQGITNGIQKVDLQAHTHGEDGWTTAYFGPERFACEPVFVPKSPTSEEGDGWLLTFIYDSNTHTSDMYVLEASDLSTVAVAKLPYHIHYTFRKFSLGSLRSVPSLTP
jgi:carotenoid cleavage dioxygenase-like enzyme